MPKDEHKKRSNSKHVWFCRLTELDSVDAKGHLKRQSKASTHSKKQKRLKKLSDHEQCKPTNNNFFTHFDLSMEWVNISGCIILCWFRCCFAEPFLFDFRKYGISFDILNLADFRLDWVLSFAWVYMWITKVLNEYKMHNCNEIGVHALNTQHEHRTY